MKYFILFGPPGAGKGTQATAMVEKYNLHHISTGALLRKEIAAETELGLQAKALIEKGCLVPDEVVEGMIESEFKTVHRPASRYVPHVCRALWRNAHHVAVELSLPADGCAAHWRHQRGQLRRC